MAGTRLQRILGQLAGGAGTDPGAGDGATGTARLCAVAADVTGMTGAGIMLTAGEASRGSVCTSDSVSAQIEQLQYTLGEGPCIDAHRQGRPVLEVDLAHPSTPRWPAFTGPAVAAGARAVFGFPLRVGAARIGVLDLYCDRPGPLTDDQHADALVMAAVAVQAVLALQADAPPGELAAALEASADFHYVEHQAAGMVAVQLGVDLAEALVRLRAYAFGQGRPLRAVADDVVARRIRLAGAIPPPG